MARQISFLKLKKPSLSFGGDLLKNSNAKRVRPLDSNLPIHLVLRSNESVMRLPKNFDTVAKIVHSVFKKHGVRMYEFANAGNHLHFVIRLHSRRSWAAMIRELTGRIAYALGTRGERFWYKLPFTRVVSGWRKAFKTVIQYVRINGMEASGYCSRADLKVLKELHKSWGWSTA